MDAIELLKKDHQEVTKLFQRYKDSRDGRGGRGVVQQICQELQVHTTIEEEIFYPAVRAADRQLAEKVQESLREHARIKEQIAVLEGSPSDDESVMTTLEQDVEHHVTEEEGEMFPRVAEVIDERRRAELGQRLQERKQELMGESAQPAGRQSASRRRQGTRRKTAAGRKSSSQSGRRAKSSGRRGRSGAAKARKTKKKASRGGRRR